MEHEAWGRHRAAVPNAHSDFCKERSGVVRSESERLAQFSHPAYLLPCPAMDYLWTPWRYAYVSSTEKTAGCVFCDAPKEKDDAKVFIVHRGQHCFVILNAYPYTPGHVMIVPYAHLDELRKLPDRSGARDDGAFAADGVGVARTLSSRRNQSGDEHRQGGGSGDRGTHSYARAAAVGRGCELRVGDRGDAGAAGDAGGDVGEDAGGDGRLEDELLVRHELD